MAKKKNWFHPSMKLNIKIITTIHQAKSVQQNNQKIIKRSHNEIPERIQYKLTKTSLTVEQAMGCWHRSRRHFVSTNHRAWNILTCDVISQSTILAPTCLLCAAEKHLYASALKLKILYKGSRHVYLKVGPTFDLVMQRENMHVRHFYCMRS